MIVDLYGAQVSVATGARRFRRERPAVLFLHGSGLEHGFWRPYLSHAAFARYSVLAPDLPGHGRSGGAPLSCVEAMSDWLAALLDLLRPGPVSLVAHSMACLVAMDFAGRRPAGLASLTLMAGALSMPVNPGLQEAAGQDPDSAVAMLMAWSSSPDAAPDPNDPLLAAARHSMRRSAPGALAADLGSCNAYTAGQSAAEATECPVQLLLGGLDRLVPAAAGAQLAAVLGAPEMKILEHCDHFLPLTAFDTCLPLLQDFVRRHNPA